MSTRIIGAIMRKDVAEFLRNRFFVFMTLLVLVVWVAVFWLRPDSVDETFAVGVHTGEIAEGAAGVLHTPDGSGLVVTSFPTTEALRRAVEEGQDDIVAGIDLPPDFAAAVAAGEVPTVQIFVSAGLGSELQALVSGLVEEMAFALAGQAPPQAPLLTTTILGIDRIGDHISLQEQMRPLLLVVVLMVETFALASLVAVEVQQRTVVAVLASPATVGDVLAAKGIFGTGLAFSEALLLGILIGALTANAPLVVVALLLGSVLVTGIGLLAGAYGRDFMGTLVVAVVFMIPLMIPAFAALFPGSTAAWIQALPTFGLVDTVVGVTARGEGWRDVAGALAGLAAWGAAAFVAGALVLRRRVVTL